MIILNVGLHPLVYKNLQVKLNPLHRPEGVRFHNEWLNNLVHTHKVLEGFTILTPDHLEWFLVVDRSPESIAQNIKSQTSQYLHLPQLPEDAWHVIEQDESIRYFYELLSGLHETILGNPKILQQAKDGFNRALEADCIGSVSHKFFHQGFELGQYLRQATDINKGAIRPEEAILELAEKIFEKISSSSILLIGPHSLMETWRDRFHPLNINRIRIMDPGRADFLSALDASTPADQFKNTDIFIAQSLPQDLRIPTQKLQDWMHQRKNRPVLIIDLDQKSIFEPGIKKIYNVFHYQQSYLDNLIRMNLEHRRKEIPKIQKQIQKEISSFMSWFFSDRTFRYQQLISRSSKMQKIFEMIDRVSGTDITILVTGEAGTGKKLIARTIHQKSTRAQHPFVAIDCSALPENLLESELFGYVKGAFSGASGNKKGLFEEARYGTLFLDEIGNLSPALQVKLLRALQEKEIRRIGSNTYEKVDVRILLATHRDLQKQMEEGKFRSDLYYRINIIPIHLPPLRERREDILLLAEYFLQNISKRLNKKQPQISPECREWLLQYDWPGNVRELENVMERAFALRLGDVLTPTDLPRILLPVPPPPAPPNPTPTQSEMVKTLEDLEKEHIALILDQLDWDYSIASKTLGIGRTTLWRKIKKYGIKQSAGRKINEKTG